VFLAYTLFILPLMFVDNTEPPIELRGLRRQRSTQYEVQPCFNTAEIHNDLVKLSQNYLKTQSVNLRHL
jgi:hypothetical protein